MSYSCKRSINTEKCGQRSSRRTFRVVQDSQRRTGTLPALMQMVSFSYGTDGNSYNSITRFSADHSRSVRPRRGSPENISHASHRKRDSISSSSSSSSTSVSPTMSSIQIPESSRLLFPSSVESGSASYFVDPLSGWSSSSSETGDDFTPYTPTFSVADINTQHSLSLTSTSSTDSAYQLAMDHTLSTFLDTPHLAYPSLSILGGRYPEERRLSGQTHTHVMPFQDMTPFYPQRGGLDMPNHFGFFEPLPSEVDGQMGLTWGNIPMALETKHRDNQKVPPTGDSVSGSSASDDLFSWFCTVSLLRECRAFSSWTLLFLYP